MTAMKIGQTKESLQPESLGTLNTTVVCLGDRHARVCYAQRHVDTPVALSLFR
jgi:hypothetical protein